MGFRATMSIEGMIHISRGTGLLAHGVLVLDGGFGTLNLKSTNLFTFQIFETPSNMGWSLCYLS